MTSGAHASARFTEILRQMRNEGPRYKSHDLGYVDSVSANNVDEWADELEAALEAYGQAVEREIITKVEALGLNKGETPFEIACEVAYNQAIKDALAAIRGEGA